MGKRSNFEKKPRNYYRTFDPKAGDALAPFVSMSALYLEPFAGAGDLVVNLNRHDIRCIGMSDIEPQAEGIEQRCAFSYTNDEMWRYDYLISNPPWAKSVFHRTLDHYVPMIDCWFLMSSNWKQNKGSARYVDNWLCDIVPIGRLKWIEGTAHSAMDDCEWLHFSRLKNEPARFHSRG